MTIFLAETGHLTIYNIFIEARLQLGCQWEQKEQNQL